MLKLLRIRLIGYCLIVLCNGALVASIREEGALLSNYGEMPLNLLRRRHGVQLQNCLAGQKVYDKIHGNNIKFICISASKHQDSPSVSTTQEDLRSVGINKKHRTQLYNKINRDRSYSVVARPFILPNKAGWQELVAFHVDRTLGLRKVPNEVLQSITHHFEIPEWGVNLTQRMVVQSLLSNVTLLFISDWINCFPKLGAGKANSVVAEHSSLTTSDVSATLGTSKRTLPKIAFGKVKYQMVPATAPANASFRMCPRDWKKYDGNWGKECTKLATSLTQCSQPLLHQLLEMFLYDFLIANDERLHRNGVSANVHAVNYEEYEENRRQQPPSSSPTVDLQLIHLDQAHYTFTANHQHSEEVGILEEHCIFPQKLLLRLARMQIKGNVTVIGDNESTSASHRYLTSIINSGAAVDSSSSGGLVQQLALKKQRLRATRISSSGTDRTKNDINPNGLRNPSSRANKPQQRHHHYTDKPNINQRNDVIYSNSSNMSSGSRDNTRNIHDKNLFDYTQQPPIHSSLMESNDILPIEDTDTYRQPLNLPLSVHVKRNMGPWLITQYLQEEETGAVDHSSSLNKLLNVVDERYALLLQILQRCASKHGGQIFVA